MASPYEIIAAPFTVYLAAVGSAFPNVDATPNPALWTLLGTSGNKNYHEDGVSVSPKQKLAFIRALGSTGPVKAYRTEEELMLSFKLMDLTLEGFKHAMNSNAVTATAAGSGTPGYKSMPMLRGQDVTQKALLIRGPSPYADSMNLDFRIPRSVHSGDPVVLGKKGEPAALLMEWHAIEDPDYANGRFGEIVGQTALSA